MISIEFFTFNIAYENTYVLSDETGECVIIDPGCYSIEEKQQLVSYIEKNNLRPVRLLLTHAHLDHIVGNNFICGKYGLKIEMNKLEVPLLRDAPMYASMWGISLEPSPDAEVFIEEGDEIKFGNSTLQILFAPGHSSGSLVFYNAEQKFVISGDVLFHESIGRTDLPGGNHQQLIQSIQTKLFILDDNFKVFPGHGEPTTIGHEKMNNPFVSPL